MSIRNFINAEFVRLLLIVVTASLPSLTRAQSTYSVNALGYVDLNLAAGSNFIANPLFSSDNTVSNLFRGVPTGTVFLPCPHAGGAFGPSNTFASATGWSSPGATFLMPDSAFLILPTPMKLSFVGQPWNTIAGSACLTYPQGDFFSGWFPNTVCGICELPGNCPPYSDGFLVYLWDRQNQQYDEGHQYVEGLGWIPSEPVIKPGDAVRVFNDTFFSAKGPFGGIGTTPTGLPWTSLRNARRSGSTFTLDWPAANNVNYAAFRSTNLNTVFWQQVQQGTATPTGGVATITITDTGSRAYYRVLPQFGGSIVLLGGGRGTASFGFQLYAPIATNYFIQRAFFTNAPVVTWTTITNVTAGPANIVSVVDQNATTANAYYRAYY
jgi:hypothetical protein